ncbi:hypothetical protein [Nitrosospira briensis]|uniref:Uncharacterized protein n=1 Tax=Nitrosospira briensis TaxID=35799 RepID=A0A1I4Z0I7_9PROT|nr:hypothetical protein [Nitrosospira briensis]SFN43697.1 hypothetical protein SAMN05216386_0965 [Nitrosospira briensis]SFO22515.1 hypothetical protein SAMN05216332_10816 [Nitrosospira briensis]
MKRLIIALFLLASNLAGSALAQSALNPHSKASSPAPDPEITRLETVLNHVNQEQQAVYQQFEMTQELRRNEIQESYPQTIQAPSTIVQGSYVVGGLKDNPPPSYDDNVRLLRERQERIQQYTEDLNRLYARYAELGEQKKVLLDQLMELVRTPAK